MYNLKIIKYRSCNIIQDVIINPYRNITENTRRSFILPRENSISAISNYGQLVKVFQVKNIILTDLLKSLAKFA